MLMVKQIIQLVSDASFQLRLIHTGLFLMKMLLFTFGHLTYEK